MKYEIKDEVKKNLIGFLARVDLKGNEVPAFNQVLTALNQPQIQKIVEEKVKEEKVEKDKNEKK